MKLSRKGILLAVLAVGCMGALGIYYLKPRHGECVKRNMMFWRTHVRATKLRDSLYMLNVYGTDLINGNTAALIGDEGVLLVDPGHPEMIRKERSALPSMRDSRVRFVIDSHAHPDHACANGELFKQGAIIVGHGNIRNYYETSKWAPRRRPGDTPQVIYDREMTLRFNGEEVRLIHPPLAHTDGDTITVFRRANVIHTGDIFVMGAFPYMKDSSIDGYIFAQELLLKLSNDQTLFVPGHGALARRDDIKTSLERMLEVRRRMTALIGEGLTKDQILARHPLDDLNPGGSRDIQSGNAVAGFVYDSMTAATAKQAPAH